MDGWPLPDSLCQRKALMKDIKEVLKKSMPVMQNRSVQNAFFVQK
jgi:hypothetical protein